MIDEMTLDTEEQKATDSLISTLKAKMDIDYEKKHYFRDAHPKQLGLLRAEFTVRDDIDPELKTGLFAEAKTYPMWIRFSNQSSTPKPDHAPDMRGVALKLVGVPGKKILPGQEDATTQDFIMVTSPIFVAKNVVKFAELVSAVTGNKGKPDWIKFARYFAMNPKSFLAVQKSNIKCGSILDLQFFSTTPYKLGNLLVKYSFKPRPRLNWPTPMPEKPEDDYLTKVLKDQLSNKDYYYDFMVQVQKDKKTMPIDDLLIQWDETKSAYLPVATVKISSQTFDTEQQKNYGDQLSFSPWHCLPDHTPAGDVNIARQKVYEDLEIPSP
ncbi:MAG: catalase family protein [Candidatus Methylacidiphilales bacterium]